MSRGEWKRESIALPGEPWGETKLSEIITDWSQVNRGWGVGGAFHLPQLDRRSDPSYVCASLPVLGSACSETSCWGETATAAAADWRDVDRCEVWKESYVWRHQHKGWRSGVILFRKCEVTRPCQAEKSTNRLCAQNRIVSLVPRYLFSVCIEQVSKKVISSELILLLW